MRYTFNFDKRLFSTCGICKRDCDTFFFPRFTDYPWNYKVVVKCDHKACIGFTNGVTVNVCHMCFTDKFNILGIGKPHPDELGFESNVVVTEK